VAARRHVNRNIQYNAFISYRRAVDVDLAEALRDALQRIAKPWYKRRALRIFHDINSLAASFDVGTAIHEALSESEFLILLASPESAASPYVQDEVEYWLANKPLANLLIAHTGGTLRWNPSVEDFDWGVTDCLPTALRGPLRKLPDYVDLTTVRNLPEPDRTAAFQARVLKLAAALHHVAPDDLSARDLSEHRRTRRVALAAIVTLVTLLITASGFGTEAFYQARQARAGQAVAESERNQAASDALAAESDATGDTNPVVARQEAAEAWQLHPSAQADYARLSAAALPGLAVLGGPDGTPADSVAFSPRNDILAVGESGGIQLWESGTYRSAGTLMSGNSRNNGIISVAFNSTGAILAAGSGNGVIQLWNTATHRLDRTLMADSSGNGIMALRFSSDGGYLAAVSVDSTQLWNTADWQLLKVFPGDPGSGLGDDVDLDAVTFGLHDTVLATMSENTVQLFNISTGELAGTLMTGQAANYVTGEAVSPGGTVLAIGLGEQIQLWNLSALRLTATITAGDQVGSLAFSPSGSILAAGTLDGTIQFWNPAARRLDNTLSLANGNPVNDLGFSANGAALAVSDTTGPAQLFAVSTAINQPTRVVNVNSGDPSAADTFTPGSILAAAANRHSTDLWNVLTGRLAATLPIGLGLVAVNPDGTMLAFAAGDEIELWNVRTAHPIATLSVGQGGEVSLLAFGPNGDILVAYTRLGLQLWNTKDRQPAGIIPVGGLSVSTMAFSPNGATLAIGSDGPVIQLWNVATRQLIGTLPPGSTSSSVTSLAFSPDGMTLAAADFEGPVQLWNVAARTFTGTVPIAAPANWVAFSPDDAVIAIGTAGGTILWDISTGQQLAKFPGADDEVAFETGGILATDGGNVIALWSVPYFARTRSALPAILPLK
jgi:WD40 repeat protein